MEKPWRLRLTLGGMMLVIAVAALVILALKPSGTTFEDLKEGTGPAAKTGDTVSVHYVGQLFSGKEFDSSRTRGTPFEFTLGRGMVITGWDKGIVGMKVGGIRRLTIPPDEGYGAMGRPPTIPPESTLVFEVELLKIQ